MAINKFFVQIRGPFTAGEELISQIAANYPNFKYIKQIGIQSEEGHIIRINNINFEIGKTNILEFDEVEVVSIRFLQDVKEKTIIDCVVNDK